MGSVVRNIGAILTVFNIFVLPALVLISIVQTAFGGSFEDHMKRHLEFIFKLWGLTGENIISTQVNDQRLLGDDYLNFMTQLALKHQKTQLGIIDLMKEGSIGIATKYGQYFRYGRDTYVNGLPSSNMTELVFPTDAVVTYLNGLYTVNSEIVKGRVGIPTKEEYLFHKLYESHQYNLATGVLKYNTFDYVIDYMDYNFGTNNYDVGIYRVNMVTTTVTTEVTTTISAYTEAYTAYSGTTSYIVNDHVMYDPGTGSKAYKCIAPSTGNLPTDTMFWVQVDYDNKHIYTKITTDVNSTLYGFSSSFTESNQDVLIPAGSETNGYSSSQVVTGPVLNKAEPTIISIVAFVPDLHLRALWRVVGTTEEHWWTYKVGSGVTSLDTLQTLETTNLDMLPIVEIRNNLVNVNSDTLSTKYIQGKAILDIVGINIDTLTSSINASPSIGNVTDAFVYFGIDPADTSPTVAKMLFKIFDYALTNASNTVVTGVVGNANEHRINVREGNFNSSLAWTYQTRNVITGSIGPLYTYQSQVVGADLYVRYQATPSSYVEYKIFELFTVVGITRGGMTGVVTKTLLSGGVVIPLSYNLIDQFSPVEQLELFCKSLRLSTYAAEITHLAYYETSAFATALQIVLIVAAIILTVVGCMAGPGGCTLGKAFLEIALAMATSYAIKKILESNLPTWAKVLAVIAAVAVAAYGGQSINAEEFLNAAQVAEIVATWAQTATTITTEMVIGGVNMATKAGEMYLENKMESMVADAAAFMAMYEAGVKKLDGMSDSMMDNLPTEFVSKLARMQEMKGYIMGYDMTRYRAGPILYDQVNLTVAGAYDNIYNYYDKALQKGMITMTL